MQVSAEEAQRIIDCAMKARGVEYLFYETSALTGQNLDEFAKQFGMCVIHTRYGYALFIMCLWLMVMYSV